VWFCVRVNVMRFCPKCGSILVPSKRQGKTVLVCRKCGYVEEVGAENSSGYRLVREIKHKPSDKIVVITKEDLEKRSNLTIVKAKCPRCGNDTAYFWMMQTRSADEPSTRFFRCTKCGYTWREYA